MLPQESFEDGKDKGLHSKAEQKEILDKEVNPTGEGEHPAVKAVLSDEFVKMSDQEALDVANALRLLVRGQADLLKNQQAQDEELRKIRERFAKMEESAKMWRDNPEKFAQMASDRADKVRLTGDAKDRMIAQGVNIWKQAREEANAEAAIEQLKFKERCANAPKVTIISPGKAWRTKVAEATFETRYEPEVISMTVGNRIARWILQPNKPTEVPDFVAKEYFARKEKAAEMDKMRKALQPDSQGNYPNYDELVKRFPDLDINTKDDGTVMNMN